jgi:hypothetical protein
MIPPLWIIENMTKEESFRALADAVKRAGYPLMEMNSGFAYKDYEHLQNHNIIFNGSIQMCRHAGEWLQSKGNRPVLYATWDNYLCTSYYPHFGKHLFNDDYVIVPLSEIERRLSWFYSVFGKEATIFIRPDSGNKTFKGSALEVQDAPRFFDQFSEERDHLAIVSSPKTIAGEWRFIVSDEEIIAQSSYRYQGLATRVSTAPKGATALCQDILKVPYKPDKVFCIDVAEDGDGNFWLMELTSFSGAGLYACNMDAIVKRISEIAQWG